MAPRVVLLHGFTQSGKSWPAAIVNAIRGAGAAVEAPDLPGHGARSDHAAGLWDTADRLGRDHGADGPAVWIGYSMGGRVALHVAARHPSAVGRLVLVGATAGLRTEAERRSRREADKELADEIERDGVDAFLDRWLANPLFATLPPDKAALEERRSSNTTAGLAASLRLAGTGTQDSLWADLGRCRMPALFVAGELDSKFALLAAEMASGWGGPAATALVPGAGHACHLEQPEHFASLVVPFLAAHPSSIPTDNSPP